MMEWQRGCEKESRVRHYFSLQSHVKKDIPELVSAVGIQLNCVD